ncbi:hypothetical protein E4U42_000683 [Claviceps africana]|uniref:Uncharacterized protein n=1 Tax=Claviceps africana TaxID=83212 RepID=A0A8K0NE69_9HYPO|nr:hypothetical protein E4U42_000683 [Claviceps africana]
MAPVRRYLRISKYSVLECRIYLDNPSLAQSWLLNPRDPVLPRIVESIRPLVLPKLREERERSKKKSSKKKSIKDVITQDDFEVSMFLTETSTRHSLLTKKKHFREKGPQMMQSNSTKLISETNHVPVDVDGEQDTAIILREEDGDDDGDGGASLSAIPAARRKRRRGVNASDTDGGDSSGESDKNSTIDLDSDTERPVRKRARIPSAPEEGSSDGEEDDKKKLAMDVSYEGFAIYGRVLCLVVRRRGHNAPQRLRQGGIAPEGQANMENWITSTQIPVGEDVP